MAGLISRASAITKAKVSKLLDRAEDPGETLDYSYEKQLELLQNVKRGLADVVTAKKRLQLQQAQLEQSVVKLDGQAHQAVAANREDLARHGARAQVGDPAAAAGARRPGDSSSRRSRTSSSPRSSSSRRRSRRSARRRK